ncbi:MAG TPA: N-acetyltransferase family protein [Victivallales bacterium]|nr:N-acetyltransferase family protein [Victivallales bacterium]
MIRKSRIEDSDQICSIYNYYIINSISTFEEAELHPKEICKRIKYITEKYPWFVYEYQNRVIGYAYASEWNPRSAYNSTVEASVYIDKDFLGHGFGIKLYRELLDELKARQFHSVLGIISLPNNSSILLHEKFGFKKIAHFTEVGYKFDKWIDVGCWELLFHVYKIRNNKKTV